MGRYYHWKKRRWSLLVSMMVRPKIIFIWQLKASDPQVAGIVKKPASVDQEKLWFCSSRNKLIETRAECIREEGRISRTYSTVIFASGIGIKCYDIRWWGSIERRNIAMRWSPSGLTCSSSWNDPDTRAGIFRFMDSTAWIFGTRLWLVCVPSTNVRHG